jgi:hypothetical protein
MVCKVISDFMKEEIMIILKMKNDKAADLLQYKPRCGRCFAL